MSATPTLDAVWERVRAVSRVVGSFIAGLGVGAVLLTPFVGPIAMIIVFGALIFGFPSLVAAIALRLIFYRAIPRRLFAWCLAAPFLAVALLFAALYWLDYRQRGFDLSAFLALEQNPQWAALAAYFAAISSLLFYWWEAASARKGQASS